jgi:hypothetical protein
MTSRANAAMMAAYLALPGWLPAVLLIVVTALVGPRLGDAARPLFLAGSLLVGRLAWSRSPGVHLQTALVLFSFTPLLRRMVDLSAGFDPKGLMVAGPLLVLLAPLPDLRKLTLSGQMSGRWLAPFLTFGACVVYCTVLTIAQGEWSQAASDALKWGAPLVYAMALCHRAPNAAQLVRDAAAAFAVILPVTGLYGVYQYVDPPMWDRYWLIYASITSAGLPAPYEVRTFSTMHAPAAFATYTAVGLLLVYGLRPGWRTHLAMTPAVMALALSLYRTAWLSLAAGMLFCLLFSKTRAKAGGAILTFAAVMMAALVFTPFGDVIANRLSTFGKASNDGSGQERLAEFTTLWSQPDGGLFGAGFTRVDVGVAGSAPIDGMIAACWMYMGIVVGLACLASLIYLIVQTIVLTRRSGREEAVILGALACGWLIQAPLAGIASGELGFLFWTTVALGVCMQRVSSPPSSQPAPMDRKLQDMSGKAWSYKTWGSSPSDSFFLFSVK